MLGSHHSSARSPVRLGARVICVLSLLTMACLPQDDLGSYSRAWENRPAPTGPDTAALPDPSALDASFDGGGASGSNGGDVGTALRDAGDAGGLVVDAGSEPSVVDAGTGDGLDAGTAPGADAAAP